MNGLQKHPSKQNRLVLLEVSGVKFRTFASTLTTFPNTRLSNLTEDSPHYSSELQCYFFDRNPNIFHFILDLYRTGKLHLPNHLCYDAFREELLFWDLDLKSVLSPCCAGTFQEYEEKKTALDEVYQNALNDTRRAESARAWMESSVGWQLWRYKVWMFLNWPDSGKWSMIWAMGQIALIFLTMIIYSLMTCDDFTYIHLSPDYNSTNASSAEEPEGEGGEGGHNHDDHPVEMPHTWLRLTEFSINCFFTFDFILRLVLAPNKRSYLKSFYQICEIIVIVTYWIFVVFAIKAYYSGDYGGYYAKTVSEFYNAIILLQLLRLLKSGKLASSFWRLKSLLLSIRYSLTEIFLICLSIVSFMFFFSVLIYYNELHVEKSDYPNIPTTFYWAVITMTSVGYGDKVPQTAGGYITASLCSITGIFLTGLAVSILANNLATYTQLTSQQQRAQKLINERMAKANRSVRNRNRKSVALSNTRRVVDSTNDSTASITKVHFENKSNDTEETVDLMRDESTLI